MSGQNRPKDWKEFDDFAAGIATNRVATTDVLRGEELGIILNSGRRITLAFPAGDLAKWQDGKKSGTDWCEVLEVARDVFFINMTFSGRPSEDEVIIANLRTGRILSIRERVRDEGEAPGEPRVMQIYTPGTLVAAGGVVSGVEPAPTRDLIGLTAHYEYSPNHVYEHIYLSSQRYAWQNLVGVQRGHGDVDMATTFKFDTNQYVFGFREFIIPVASVFFYNWDTMRSTGKFLGVTSSGAIENKPAGAFIEKKSVTTYPQGRAPV
ncbi:MAG: MoaF N-terminal domain-containing protein [Rhodobiaceae bacterium]|nr:MoaF N-terminal domain-containing protein [Rhodobiaceae bacterium]